MPSRTPPASAGKSAALPRGGGLAGGIEGEEQGDKKNADSGEANDAALGDLESITLSDFNRWIVTESNYLSAQEIRDQSEQGRQFRKARDDRHRELGQLRQQDTVEQMKEAKTKLDAHRRANLEQGSLVKRDVQA